MLTDELEGIGPAADIMKRAREAWAMVRKPFAPNTEIAYDRAYARYTRWCDAVHVEPLPCSAAQLVAFLQWFTHEPNTSPSSVLQAASAIASIDRWSRTTPENDRPVSVTASAIYQRWLQAWLRRYGKVPKKKAPTFGRDALARVIASLDTPTSGAAVGAWKPRAARDRALWLVGLAGALRVNELEALNVEHVVRVPEGLIVTIPSSKTDQAGAGDVIGIEPSAVHTLCPVRAWEAWLLERGEWHGPAFVAVSRSGKLQGARLTKRSLQTILTTTAARTGLRISSHSLRRVFATTVTHQRKRADRIMSHARWTRVETMHEYVHVASLWDDNPTRGLFEGDW
jgi:integrase